MELRDYIQICKKHKNIFSAFALLGIFGALAVSIFGYQGYRGELSLIIRPSAAQQTADFQYNGFYALESSDRVTRMIEQRLKDDDLPITTKRLGSQYLAIIFVKQNESELQPFQTSIEKEVTAFTASLAKYPQDTFEAATLGFVSKKRTAPLLLNLLIGLAAGIVVGFFGALFRHYSHKEVKSSK